MKITNACPFQPRLSAWPKGDEYLSPRTNTASLPFERRPAKRSWNAATAEITATCPTWSGFCSEPPFRDSGTPPGSGSQLRRTIKVPVEEYVLSGKFDLYDDETKIVTDYKTAPSGRSSSATSPMRRQTLIIAICFARSALTHRAATLSPS
jgi:hypothetical protein